MSLATWDNHPAKYSQTVLDAARPVLGPFLPPGSKVLDPFGGTGLIHSFGESMGWDTTAVEIEIEGANMHPRTIHGDATDLPACWVDRFDGTFTSCCYANRMADHHNAKEKCRSCQGTGRKSGDDCEKCDGQGRRFYKRLTYTHTLGHDLHPNNSGRMQWGKAYRDLHEDAWAEVTRVTRDWFCLNISNHIRAGEEVDVTSWHQNTIKSMGWTQAAKIPVFTPRLGFGANREARVENEWLILFQKH